MGSAETSSALRVFERGWLSSNNVLFHDDDGSATLVDSGYFTHREQTLALVQGALAGRKLTRIVNTHLHSDHCGGNARLQQATGARVAIPPGLADAVARWDEDALSFRSTGQRCERFHADDIIEPGATLRLGGAAWDVLAAPGHDPHSVMLWNDADGVLISADVLWEHGFGAIFPEIEGQSGFAEQAAMLDLIAKLRPRRVIPGHGAPFTDIDAPLARARDRLAALSSDPARNARHVARVLIKFYLLEVREVEWPALVAHLDSARYFHMINDRYFRLPFERMVGRSVDELAAAGAAERREGRVVNRDG